MLKGMLHWLNLIAYVRCHHYSSDPGQGKVSLVESRFHLSQPARQKKIDEHHIRRDGLHHQRPIERPGEFARPQDKTDHLYTARIACSEGMDIEFLSQFL